MQLTCVTVNYFNDALAIAQAVRLLEVADRAPSVTSARVIIADNSSSIGGSERAAVESATEGRLRVLPLPDRGYAAGINAAICDATGSDWYLIMNQKAEYEPELLASAVETAVEHGIDLLGFQLADACGTVVSSGISLDLLYPRHVVRRDERDSVVEPVDAIDGTGWLFSRPVWERVGPLDESMFMYWEETDWCVRAAQEGIQPYVYRGLSLKISRNSQPWSSFYKARNGVRFYRKHRRRLRSWILAAHQLAIGLVGVARAGRDIDLRRHHLLRAKGAIAGIVGSQGPHKGLGQRTPSQRLGR